MTCLTGERPDLEMTDTFGPVKTRSAPRVIGRGVSMGKSLQKVFPRGVIKSVFINDSFDTSDW